MGKGLDVINKLDVVSFKWKDSDINDIGLIAEEVAKVIPEAVYYKDGKVEGLRFLPLIAVCIQAIKELEEK